MRRLAVIFVASILALMGGAMAALADNVPDIGAGDVDGDNEFAVEATQGGRGPNGDEQSSSGSAVTAANAPVVEYVRGTECARPGDWNFVPNCEGAVPREVECPDGAPALEPLFSRTQNDDGSWTPWTMVNYYTCPNNADALIAAVQHEWSTLTPIPTSATIQPDSGWVYANVPTIAIADDGAQLHTATLLGALVDIRATPAHYTWMWGDGEQTVTEDPGSPYPNATLTHTYAHQQGDVTLNLETSWAGEYRINGGAWSAFGSNIASDSPPINLEVRNPHSQLVACTTDGRCR